MDALTINDRLTLDDLELTVLGLHASGMDGYDIDHELGIDTHTRQAIEKTAQKKLGARTVPHMVARAFQLGVIKPLCLLLVLVSALQPLSVDQSRLRTASRLIRNPNTITRTVQAGRNLELTA